MPNLYRGFPIESGTLPLLNHACGEATGCHAGCQGFSRCRTRGQSQGTYHVHLCQVRIRLPTLALKPGGDVTRSPNEGFQWPHKKNLCPPIIFKKMCIEHCGKGQTKETSHFTLFTIQKSTKTFL